MNREKAPWQEWFVQMEYGSNRALVFYPWELNRPPSCLHMLEKTNYDALAAVNAELKADLVEAKEVIDDNYHAAKRERERGDFYRQKYKDLLVQANSLFEGMPDIPDECGEHTHLGNHLDHKDCDIIRETKAEWIKWKADNNVE